MPYKLYVNHALYSNVKLYTSVESLECQELAISYYELFGYSYVNYYAYKVVCSTAGYKYSYTTGKGVLVSYNRYYIIYSCN